MVEYITNSHLQTFEVGKLLAKRFSGGETVLLCGNLGAGKTALAKGVAAGLGVLDEVTSPTFTLHNVYRGKKLQLNHFDFYKIDDGDFSRVENLGLAEYFGAGDAVALIEWAQNISPLLPKNCLKIEIEQCGGEDGNCRKIRVFD